MKEWSSRQGCEFSGVEVPVPSITCFGRLAYPRHVEVTKHDVLGRKSHKPPCRNAVVGATRVASKPRGLNITKWLQPRKFTPLRRLHSGVKFQGYIHFVRLRPIR